MKTLPAWHALTWAAVAAAAIAAMGDAAAQAAAYPQGPVKLVVGFAAGGPSDLVARAFADHAARPLGQPVIVENKPGANAVLATEAVAASKPDALSFATPGQGSSPHLASAARSTPKPAMRAN